MGHVASIAAAGALLALGLAACAPPSGLAEARSALRTNDYETARRLLEAERERRPSSEEVRIALGELYYRMARDALDWDGDEGRYLAFLERSIDEFVVAAELAPKSHQPHFYLALIDVYQGDLPSALRGLRNARRLSPGPIADTNIAELYVYAGDPVEATRWNQSGRHKGAGTGPVTFNEMLLDWRAGEIEAARDAFELLRVQYPEMVRTINVAPLPTMPRHFEEFAGYCCASPACGPYLEHACTASGLEVKYREVSEETLLKELRLEMESRRRMREIYRQRKELELELEVESDGAAGDADERD